jgi:hypothetical protein
MKALAWVALALALGLGACATGAQREMARMGEAANADAPKTKACFAQVTSSPEGQMMAGKLGGDPPGLAAQVNPQKATPEEAQQVLSYHRQLAPCRKMMLESFSHINPALVPPVANSFARSDSNYAKLVTQKSAWGEFAIEASAIARDRQSEVSAIARTIDQGLAQSHNAEVSQRQAAAAALQNWSYQQQILQQNQQAINAANRPRMTNCQYVGTYLNCTSF